MSSHYLLSYKNKKPIQQCWLFLLHSLALALVVLLAYILTPLPEPLVNTSYSKILLDKDQYLLGARIADDEQWRFSPTSKLPEKYKTAVITFEDKRFYQHIGVDVLAIARAAQLNWQAKKVVSGGSTITMQLARLIRGNHARNYTQKLLEILLALRLDFQLSKEEILLNYAALAPFGGNTVGFYAANWRYFNQYQASNLVASEQALAEMTWAQAALLAILPNNPSGLHLSKKSKIRQRLLDKRNSLLARLHNLGHLSKLDYQLALQEVLPEKPTSLPREAEHLLSTLSQRWPNQSVYHSHIDRDLQQHLNHIVDSYNLAYEKNNVHNLSVLVLDDNEQAVLAYLGNKTRSELTRYAPKLDIIQRPRSSGSLFKAFLFAFMIQEGLLLPESLVEDIPSFFDGYQPKNYDRSYRGLIQAKQALSQSLNVPAVRMLQSYGVPKFKQDLQRLGLSTIWRPADDYGLSLILGGAETTLWDMANSFSRMVNSAKGHQITENEASLFTGDGLSQNTSHYPIEQGAAWLTLKALFEVYRPSIAANWKTFSSSQNIAWKTGTSYGWHDAWAVGSNGRYTVAVWAGNANNEEARELTGTHTAAPIMFDAFSYLGAGEWPEKPELALKQYEVCENDGYLPSNDCKTQLLDAPVEAHFELVSKYHQRVHIDPVRFERVHGLCETPANMQAKTYFVVPPIHRYYMVDSEVVLDYLPDWRQDCLENLPEITQQLPFDIEYPSEGLKLSIPVQLDGKLGRIIAKAKHNNDAAQLYWHLDKEYLGSSQHIHEKTIVANPGWHKLTVVDEKGYKIDRWFKVL